MNHKGTDYNIAKTGSDYAKVHAFLRENEKSPHRLTYPTIMAERGGSVVGVWGTYGGMKQVIIGAYVNTGGNPLFVLIKLADLYNALALRIGLRLYKFAVDKSDISWVRTISKLGFEAYAVTRTQVWFRRTIQCASTPQ